MNRAAHRLGEGYEFTWPRAVQFLLRTYATDGNLYAGVQNLFTIKQMASEFEHELIERIHQAHNKLGAFFG